jgi:hypothetical protein
MRTRSWIALTLVASFPFALGNALAACSSDPESTGDASTTPTGTATDATIPPTPDASSTVDAAIPKDGAPQNDASQDSASDASCADAGTTAFGPGDTCAPFGEGPSCGGCVPKYGYVCTNGGPPNLTGCTQVSNSAFGGTYCCPTLSCVRVTSEDPKCAGRPGKTQMYSCPVDGAQNLRAQPPPQASACDEVAGPTYRYFCCPP